MKTPAPLLQHQDNNQENQENHVIIKSRAAHAHKRDVAI